MAPKSTNITLRNLSWASLSLKHFSQQLRGWWMMRICQLIGECTWQLKERAMRSRMGGILIQPERRKVRTSCTCGATVAPSPSGSHLINSWTLVGFTKLLIWLWNASDSWVSKRCATGVTLAFFGKSRCQFRRSLLSVDQDLLEMDHSLSYLVKRTPFPKFRLFKKSMRMSRLVIVTKLVWINYSNHLQENGSIDG